MIAPLAKLMDWSVLQVGYAMLPQSMWREAANEGDLKLEQAVQFLNGPDFIPAESQPAQLDFGPDASGGRFRFPTPRPCEFAENNVVHGGLYRCADAWQERPVIVLLHGGGDFPGHQLGFHLFARRCQRAGFNAATLELPYHFQRRPRQRGALSSLDYLRVAEAFSQAVAEIRALTGWLLGQGCPAVALWGVSLGGWRAELAACCDARLSEAVLAVPAVCMNHLSLYGEQVVWRRVRQMMRERREEHEALDRTPLNLISCQPVIPRENILLIEGIHDVLVHSGPVEQLWNAWGQPEIWRLAHGHMSWMGVPSVTNRILHWLTPRLSANAIERARS